MGVCECICVSVCEGAGGGTWQYVSVWISLVKSREGHTPKVQQSSSKFLHRSQAEPRSVAARI